MQVVKEVKRASFISKHLRESRVVAHGQHHSVREAFLEPKNARRRATKAHGSVQLQLPDLRYRV